MSGMQIGEHFTFPGEESDRGVHCRREQVRIAQCPSYPQAWMPAYATDSKPREDSNSQ